MAHIRDIPLASVDGQSIDVGSLDEAVEMATEMALERRGFTFFTLNLDHLVKLRRHPRFRAAYQRATFVSADGAPVVALARRAGARIARTTGADLVLPLCAEAARHRLPVALFGSTAESLRAAASTLRRRHAGLEVRAAVAPPFGFDPESPEAMAAADALARSGARLVFVALGAPKQELFADLMHRRHPSIGLVCVGAALDFLSGRQRRAPRLLQRTGLEWAWRLLANPRAMASRYAACASLLLRIALLEPLTRSMARSR